MAERADAEELRRRVAELEAEVASLRRSGYEAAEREARRSEALLAELQHRVRNMLAVVRAVVRRTEAAGGGRDAEEFAAHLSGRLDALARVQGVLTRTGEQTTALEELVREEFLFQGGIGDEQVLVEGPPVLLRGKAAETLALALHELASNAVKFGALGGEKGRVEVRWRAIAEGTDGARNGRPGLLLEWTESGAECDGTPPDRTGFGRDLIEQGLPYGLGARTALEFRAGGIRCAMTLPLAQQPGTDDGGVLVVEEPTP